MEGGTTAAALPLDVGGVGPQAVAALIARAAAVGCLARPVAFVVEGMEGGKCFVGFCVGGIWGLGGRGAINA